jgi:hypothetical protein
MATFSNGESGFSVRTKINDVLQHMDGTAGTLVVNEAGADVDFRVESDTNTNAIYMDGATGNVGIGTGTPVAELHVFAASDPEIRIQNGTLLSVGRLGFYTSTALDASISITPNNGIFDISSGRSVAWGGSISFTTDTAERMRISPLGNVGIGTASPAVALHTVGRVRAQKSGATGAFIQISADELTSNYSSDIFLNDNGLTFRVNSGSRGFVFDQNGTERMRIDNAGNVAIGTSAPLGARLKVTGADISYLAVINGASYGVRIGSTAGVGANVDAVDTTGVASYQPMSLGGSIVALQTDGTERMRVTTTGNVGINTITPTNRLQIVNTPPPTVPAAGASGHTLAVGTTPYGVAVGTLSDGRGYIQATRWDGTATNYNLLIQPNGGDVGIGTSSPVAIGGHTGVLTLFGSNATGIAFRAAAVGKDLRFNSTGALSVTTTGGATQFAIDDVGNIGIGVTPSGNYTIQGASNFNTGFKGANFGGASIGSSGSGYPLVGYNVRFSATGDTYTYNASDFANAIAFRSGQFQFFNAASGTAGAALTFTQAMTLDASGNLGLGTASPSARLTVVGAAGTNLVSTLTSAVNTGSYIGFLDTTTTDRPLIGALGDNFVARTFGVERMRITSGGLFGIGTTSSDSRMTISADNFNNLNLTTTNASSFVRIHGQGTGGSAGLIVSSNGPMVFHTGATTTAVGTERARIDDTGNLLVGTTSVGGSASNTAVVVGGGFRTASNLVSATTAVPITIFSITAANRGLYEVVAMIANSGSATLYSAISTILWDGSTGRAISNNGTNLTITLSGSDVQITQTAGTTQTVYWSARRNPI